MKPPPGSWLVKSTGSPKRMHHSVCWAGDFDSIEPTLEYVSLMAAAPDMLALLEVFAEKAKDCTHGYAPGAFHNPDACVFPVCKAKRLVEGLRDSKKGLTSDLQ